MVLKRLGLTGASGMLGRHVVSLLFDIGVETVATSLDYPGALPLGSSWQPWDLEQWKSPQELDHIFPEVQALIHMGAIVPNAFLPSRQKIFDANIRSCLCLGEWAVERGIPIVFISGSTVYADSCRQPIYETDPTSPCGFGGFYGFSKLMGEEVFAHLAGQGLQLCILRPSSMYGCGLDRSKMLMKFLLTAAGDEMIELMPPVEDRINLVHASDVAWAVIRSLEHEARGVFNIAGEKTVSILEIAETCIEVAGRGQVSFKEVGETRLPEVRFALNCEAAREAFGYRAQISLKKGIAMIWNDMKKSNRS